jgi:hypothetical protein
MKGRAFACQSEAQITCQAAAYFFRAAAKSSVTKLDIYSLLRFTLKSLHENPTKM